MRDSYFQLVVAWASGDTQVFTGYKTREEAEQGGRNMELALGEQVAYWCVRDAHFQ